MRYLFLVHPATGAYYAARYAGLTVDAAMTGPLAVTPDTVTANDLLTATYGPHDSAIYAATIELQHLDDTDNVLRATTDLVTPAFLDTLFPQ